MRALTYNQGREILRPEIESGHAKTVTYNPMYARKGIAATEISDGSVLVLIKLQFKYIYEWYSRREL